MRADRDGQGACETDAAELQGASVGGWTVGEYLGNGASAVVLTAHRGDQTAALKLIDPEMEERFGADQQLARVERERELVDTLNRTL